MKEKLESYLKKIILDNFQISLEEISTELPPKKELGDMAFGGFPLAKELRKSPIEIVQSLKDMIRNDMPDFISSVSTAGPYLNIFFAKDMLFQNFIKHIKTQKAPQEQGTVIVDYIGANVGKPLHIGHMCTPNQGQALINTYKALGYNVVSDSHIGDWGIIFGKLITAYKMYGNEEELHQNAVAHLFQLYVQISAEAEKNDTLDQEFRNEFKKLSEGDADSVKLWSQFTRYSIDSMNILLSRINVQPQYDVGESFYEGIGLPKMGDYPDLNYSMKEIVEELIEKGIATKNDDNSVGVVFNEDLKIPSCILQKRDGTHGYLASDLATIKYRMENWSPDKIIYCVDVRQQLHLRQVFIVAKAAGWLQRNTKPETELFHAYNGFISLKDGAMSTRKGKIIRLGDLLDEAEKRAADIIQEKRDDISGEELTKVSKIIGIGAIKYGYLKKGRETDVIFDWDEFMSFEGNSGPYIQYAYVRAKNIGEKAEIQDIENSTPKNISPEFTTLMSEIMRYDTVLQESAQTYHPHILCQYAYALAKSFSNFYNTESILQESDENYKHAKIFLVKHFAQTLKNTFALLGIDMPEKM